MQTVCTSPLRPPTASVASAAAAVAAAMKSLKSSVMAGESPSLTTEMSCAARSSMEVWRAGFRQRAVAAWSSPQRLLTHDAREGTSGTCGDSLDGSDDLRCEIGLMML